MNKRSGVYSTIFILLIVFLMVLPVLLTFNEFLTKALEKFKLYQVLQDYVVPIQIRMVTVLVGFFGVKPFTHVNGFTVNGTFLEMTWNCVGWQSLFLFTITLWVGFKNGIYTLGSKLETVAIGLLGTFMVNLLRLTIIILVFAYLRPIYGVVYHDYLAAIITTAWLFYFWHFSYKYILRQKISAPRKLSSERGEV